VYNTGKNNTGCKLINGKKKAGATCMVNELNYGSTPANWPFPVTYDKENRIETDVLIIG
jgi:hypothetical protein